MNKTGMQLMEEMFGGAVEYVFHGTLGIVDPAITDYLGDLLIRFSDMRYVYKLRTVSGYPVTDVECMYQEAILKYPEARFHALRHVGDYSLFWFGLYPEAFRQTNGLRELFIRVGSLAYCRAYENLSESEDGAVRDVLLFLSKQFMECAYGFYELRRMFEANQHEVPYGPFVAE